MKPLSVHVNLPLTNTTCCVQVTGVRRLYVRLLVGLWLIRLGNRVIGISKTSLSLVDTKDDMTNTEGEGA